ncbi:centrosomal protein of 290 kDa-like, partial [Saccostrea cucullata]|uniref:centrosomal protein of 290 kDa-like n=1 Tax=Saccostrea cuccullata TaxID=36930 RepID=UPI002ED0CBD3
MWRPSNRKTHSWKATQLELLTPQAPVGPEGPIGDSGKSVRELEKTIALLKKDMATFKMAALQKAIEDSVPAADLELMNKRYHDLTEKYRDTLEKGNTLVSKAVALVGLENEVKRLTEDNEVLKKTLGLEKEKLHALEAAVEDLHKK